MTRAVLLAVLLSSLAVAGPVPSPPPDATMQQRGLVSTKAQAFTGAKTFDGGVTAASGAPAVVPLVALGAPGQSADLQQWQVDGGFAARIDVTGRGTFDGGAELGGDVLLNAPAGLGTGYANPAFRVPINGTNQTYLMQLGGTGPATWELAIGYYTGAFAPLISTRGNLLFSTTSGGSVSPASVSDLGVVANPWRNVTASGTVSAASLTCSAISCKGLVTLSGGTANVTVFTGAVCNCTLDTSAGTAAPKCHVVGTTLTVTGTGTDVIAYHCH